jgi:adenylate cyclase
MKKGRLLVLVSGLALSVFWAALYLQSPAFLKSIDDKLYDNLVTAGHNQTECSVPVIVDLDEKSLGKFGQWPWPRYRMARLLNEIKDAGAASIALDIVFAESDRTSPSTMQQNLERDLNVNLDLRGFPEEFRDNDRLLAEVLAQGPFVLGYEFVFNHDHAVKNEARLHKLPAVIMEAPDVSGEKASFFTATGVLANLPVLAEAAPLSGFFNVTPDLDGVLRRVPLVVEYKGSLYPCLALAAIMQATGHKQVILKIRSGGLVEVFLGRTAIPVDLAGNLMLRFHGKSHSFEYLSAAEILDGKFDAAKLKGRIVFVGTSAMGLAEMRTTAFSPIFPGVETHATVVDNILSADFISRPPFAPHWELGVTLLLCVVFSFLLAYTGAAWSVLILGAVGLGVWWGAGWMLNQQGLLLSPLYPLLAMVSAFSFLVLLRFWIEQRKSNRRMKALLQSQNLAMQSLASLAETRDDETGAHIQRTQEYVKILCEHLASKKKFKDYFKGYTIDLLYKSAPLHDIGKVGVPDGILLKAGPLTDDEFEQMKKHTTYGKRAITKAEERSGAVERSSFLRYAKEVIYCHHEKWDGSGYPEHLKGEDIPLAGRIMALADVYDALISDRVYRAAMSHEEAREIIIQGKGTHFDPDLVEAFLQVQELFRETAGRIQDEKG